MNIIEENPSLVKVGKKSLYVCTIPDVIFVQKYR